MSGSQGLVAVSTVVPAAGGGDVLGELRLHSEDDRGMVSAEWAVGIIAAVAIAGVLLAVVTTGSVQEALLDFILGVIRGFAKG